MTEACSIRSIAPGPAPDFPIGLGEPPPHVHPPCDREADGSVAYGILISRALSEVTTRRDRSRPSLDPNVAGDVDASSPDPRIYDFVEALLEGNARSSRAIAEAAFAEVHDPQKLAASLFGPAACRIGERWIADESDFLQVTIAFARMQQIFARLAAEHPPAVRPDPARRLLLAPTPGEQHGFGLSLAEDAFQRAGWTVDCAGGDGERMLRLAAANDYPLIGVSIGSEKLLPALRLAVARLRMASRNGSAVLMAGGGVAVRDPASLLEIGFDVVATNASAGVSLAESIVAQRANGPHRTAFAH